VEHATSQNWTYSPGYDDSGTYNVTLVVSDGESIDSQQWNVTVNDVNRPPTIDSYTPPADPWPEVDEGDSLEFTHTSSDPDNDTLTYSWWLDSVNQTATQNWTYSPGYDDSGTYNVTLVVSDGESTDSQQWNVTVLNINRLPEASNVTIIPSLPHTNNNLTATYTYTDADGDPESVPPNGTEIRWYTVEAGVPVPQLDYNDILEIPSSATAIGEEWYFTVRPNDGTDFGELKESPHVTVTA